MEVLAEATRMQINRSNTRRRGGIIIPQKKIQEATRSNYYLSHRNHKQRYRFVTGRKQ